MELTTFDFGDVCIGTIEDEQNTIDAQGAVRFRAGAMLQLGDAATGRLERLKDLEPGSVVFAGADGLDLTDNDYRALAAIPGLRSVDFDNTQINADQIGYFCRDGMRALSLAAESLTDAAMPAIASVPSLVHLFASRSSLTDAGLAHLRGHAAIESLHLSSTGVTAASAHVVATLPSLTTLEMPGATDDVLVAAARAHSHHIQVRSGALTGAGLRALSRCASLAILGLIDATLDDSACEALGQLGSVESLSLHHSRFDDEALGAALKSMTGLRSVNFRNSSAGDGALAGLSHLPCLTAVHSVNTAVTDAGVAQLAGVATLESVDFAGTALTPTGLARLTQLPEPFELG